MTTPAPLTPAEVQQVLRYWLRAIRQEEALSARPHARRPPRTMPPIDLRDPSDGQDYARLDDSASWLLRDAAVLRRPMDPGMAVFFERWLKGRYQAAFAIARGWIERDEAVWLAGWPTIHLARRGELACLLRFETEVRWRTADDAVFRPPSYAERKGNTLPELPVALELEVAPISDDPEAEAPFSIDTHLLTRTLGVTDEEVTALLPKLAEARSGEAVVRQLCAVLETDHAPLPEDATAETLMQRLTEAVEARLPDGARVWPVGIVYDGTGQYTTWHLQREMVELMRRPPGKQAPWTKASGLWSYLSGAVVEPAYRPLQGVRAARGLTADQRAVAERFLGTALTAAQGPPGTGKTDLILNLAADCVVRRARALADAGEMDDALLMVCSTNNRAVDNVTDALTEALPWARLPVALRVGSREVTATTAAQLMSRAIQWLDAQDATNADARLDTMLARLRTAVDAYEARVSPIQRHQRRVTRLARIEARLAELEGVDLPEASTTEIEKAVRAVRRVRTRLLTIEDLLARGKADSVVVAARHTKRLNALDFGALEKALGPLGLEVGWALPPEIDGLDAEARQASWEEAVSEACSATDALSDRLLDWKAARKQVLRRTELREEAADLRALVADAPPPPDQPELDALAAAIYERALEVRELWAISRAKPLRQALGRAMAAAQETRSLRKALSRAPEVETWLRRLFPVWGSTLLSLGNVLTPAPASVDHMVIDEAGQCHPAYAISALMRASRTLIIGDVHQLEPVIDLTTADLDRAEVAAKVSVEPERFAPYRLLGTPVNASAQSLANRALGEPLALHDHFRCQPEIIGLSDRLCGYGLKVRTPARSLADRLPLLAAPVLFAQVRGAQARVRGSWVNEAEAEAIMRLLQHLLQAGVPWSDVAVLTPYVGQLDLLRTRLRAARVPTQGAEGLATGTVHRFQGGERRVVLFSTVVTRGRSLAFLDRSVNLVNVAVSRAMDHLIVLGDAETLLGGRYTKVLVERGVPIGRQAG